MGKTSNAAKDRYNAKAYDDIRLRVPKDKIQAFAEAMGWIKPLRTQRISDTR